MSGWIKFDKDMADDPRLLDAAARLAESHSSQFELWRNAVTGALLRLWCHADTHISDDDVLPGTAIAVDSMLGIRGFCAAMPDDWIQITDAGRVRLPGYVSKNALIAKEKRREQAAERARRYRAKQRNASDTRSSRVTRNVSRAVDQDQDQDLKEKKKKRAPPDFSTVPNLDQGAWAAWLAYRKAEDMPTYKSTQVATKLAAYPPEVQRAAVDISITAGWRGLFPQNVRNEKRGPGGRNSFDEHTQRLAEWYLEQTGAVLPGNA